MIRILSSRPVDLAKNCSSCGHSRFEGTLSCFHPAQVSLDMGLATWLLKATFDEEGFPLSTPGPCPRRLRELWATNASAAEMGRRLSRSPTSVRHHARLLGLEKRP